jgi:Icc-related predicted phosphoesterase
MKLTFISDTHNKHNQVTIKETDILFHTGDMTSRGRLPEVKAFLHWFSKQPAEHKILIAGNHDWLFAKDPNTAKLLLEEYPNITYLQDQTVIINNLRIYGSPWQPRFYDWAFNADNSQLYELWDKIPGNTEILLTHGPPHKFLDLTYDRRNVGCEILKMNVIKRVKPMIHAFGHIHEARLKLKFGDTTFVNSCCLDEDYIYKNEPIVMEI